jgi:hypothetical protein
VFLFVMKYIYWTLVAYKTRTLQRRVTFVLLHKSFVTTLYSKGCGVAEEEQFSADTLRGDLLSVSMTTRNNTEQSNGRVQRIERPLN